MQPMLFLTLTFASVFHFATGEALNNFYPANLTAGILSLRKLIESLKEGDSQAKIQFNSHRSQSNDCDFSVQAQANRLSLFLYYPELGEKKKKTKVLDLHPLTFGFLEDCKWDMNVTTYIYDENGTIIDEFNKVTSGDRSDAMGFARNVEGNSHILPNTCASIWQGTNDDLDGKFFTKMIPLKLKPEDAPGLIMGTMTPAVSQLTHNVFAPLHTMYKGRLGRDANQYHHLMLNSDECENILITGHSLGGALSSLYRIDYGDVEDGLYTHTCFGGKPCTYYAIQALQMIWYGNVPEFATYSNSTVYVWYESDPTATSFPNWLQTIPLATLQELRGAGFDQFSDPKKILLRWRTRDAVFHNTKDGLAARRVVVDLDIVNQSAWEWRSSPKYTQRLHLITAFGPFVAVRVCFQGSITWMDLCHHSAAGLEMEDFLKMDDEMVKDDTVAHYSGNAIPDLPGSAFNQLVHTLVKLKFMSK